MTEFWFVLAVKHSPNEARSLFSDLEPVEHWIVDLQVDFRTTHKGTILYLAQGSNFFQSPLYF